MTVDLSVEELDYVHMLLEKRQSELLHELHHAVTNQYKNGLKAEVEMAERLLGRLALGRSFGAATFASLTA